MLRILTTCFNAGEYIECSIQSMKMQNMKDWKCYIADDLSTDNSPHRIKDLTADDSRFVFINNSCKQYQVGNYWQILQRPEIQNDDICITIDGDDWLPDGRVFDRVNSYYSKRDIWLTFGQYMTYQGNGKYLQNFKSALPVDCSQVRKLPWKSTHLRTFKAGLFRKIAREDLIGPKNIFWETTGDMAMMFPMIEMAGNNKIYCADNVNYIYNLETPLNDEKCNAEKQREYEVLIRNKSPYSPLKEANS